MELSLNGGIVLLQVDVLLDYLDGLGGLSSGSKISSIERLKSLAILKAKGRLGSYLPRSSALTVWRETPSAAAKSP